MGTRADFYVGRGPQAEWLGSIAWDGYPEGIAADVLKARTENAFRSAVTAFIAGRDDGTKPEMGWPWPWNDSGTSDYGYCFDGGLTWWSDYAREEDERAGWSGLDGVKPGTPGWSCLEPDSYPGVDDGHRFEAGVNVWPDMSARKNVTMGARSGVIVVSR